MFRPINRAACYWSYDNKNCSHYIAQKSGLVVTFHITNTLILVSENVNIIFCVRLQSNIHKPMEQRDETRYYVDRSTERASQ